MKINLLILTILLLSTVITETRSQDLFPVRQMTSDQAQEGFATWSPDGRTIVYQHTDMRDSSGKNGLWRISSAGGRAKQIYKGIAEHARWSPDGKSIVFDADTGNTIRIVSSKGGKATTFLPDSILIQNGGLPCWSPDGSRIAFLERKRSSLCTYDFSTGEIKSLYREEGRLPIPGCWCSDGKSILVADMDRKTRESVILRVDSNGKYSTRITGNKDNFYRYLALSPDGSLLVYAVLEGRYVGLYIMAAEGGRSIPLAVTVNSHNEGAAWSPDGSKIAFTSTRSGSFDIWVMDVDLEYVKRVLSIITDETDFYPI